MDNDPVPVQEQKKEKALNELLTSSIVDIYIGPESTHWPLHERLVCYHSPFLAKVFYNDHDRNNNQNGNKSSSRKNKSYGFPDEEDYTFTLLVGWLYGRTVPPPKNEKDIGPLLDLYLLGEKLQIESLSTDVVDTVREYYHSSSTYPGLRRVQYIYGNTDEDNEMREMMVSSVARQLATTEKIPAHWANALQRNGQLAVDIIRSIQRWHIEERSIPDVRDTSLSSGRGRKGNKMGFSAIVREDDSLETEATGMTGSLSLGSNLGVESITSDETGHNDEKQNQERDESSATPRSISEAGKELHGGAELLTLSSLSLFQAQLKRPPETPRHDDLVLQMEQSERLNTNKDENLYKQDSKDYQADQETDEFMPKQPQPQPQPQPVRKPRRNSVTFNPTTEIMPCLPVFDDDDDNDGEQEREGELIGETALKQDQTQTMTDQTHEARSEAVRQAFRRPEVLFLGSLWIVYGCYVLGWAGVWDGGYL